MVAGIASFGLSCDHSIGVERMYSENPELREMNFSNSARDENSRRLVNEARSGIAYSNIFFLGGVLSGVYLAYSGIGWLFDRADGSSNDSSATSG